VIPLTCQQCPEHDTTLFDRPGINQATSQERYRQVTTAVADGTIAELSAVDYKRAWEEAVPLVNLAPAAETAH
jgi:hypothetical protein